MAVVAPTITRFDNNAVYKWVLTAGDTVLPFDVSQYRMITFFVGSFTGTTGGAESVAVWSFPDGTTQVAPIPNLVGNNASLSSSVTAQSSDSALTYINFIYTPAATTGVTVYMIGRTSAIR